jgi:hypothetical protein
VGELDVVRVCFQGLREMPELGFRIVEVGRELAEAARPV